MALGIGGQIALQGGIDIGSGILGNLFQKRNIRLQKEGNLELANYAWQKDKEMWHMQNLYNTPQNQMQRFADAGLNPNLIYSRGQPGMATTSPRRQNVAQGLRQTNIPRMNVIGQYQMLRQQNASIENQQADTRYKGNLADTQESTAAIQSINAELKNAERFFKLYPNSSFKGQQYTNTRYFNQQQNLYNLQAKKNNLLNMQIDLAQQKLLTEQRKYRWMPWEKGFSMGAKTAGTALGAVGVGKIGKASRLSRRKVSYGDYLRSRR